MLFNVRILLVTLFSFVNEYKWEFSKQSIKALIIAFSSDFIEKSTYLLENQTLSGFTRSNLFESSESEKCYFFPSKHHDYIEYTSSRYLQLICLKLAFVIIYQANFLFQLKNRKLRGFLNSWNLFRIFLWWFQSSLKCGFQMVFNELWFQAPKTSWKS